MFGGRLMTSKRQGTAADPQAAAGQATAVDYVKTKQELDTAAAQRQAETELPQPHPAKGAASSPTVHLKQDEDEDSIQSFSDELSSRTSRSFLLPGKRPNC